MGDYKEAFGLATDKTAFSAIRNKIDGTSEPISGMGGQSLQISGASLDSTLDLGQP